MLHRLRQQAAVAATGAAALLFALATGAAWAADHGTPLPTRLVQAATQAEEGLLTVVRARDARRLEALLGEDFAMLAAPRPDEAVPLEDWVDAMTQQAGAGDYTVRAMTARELAPGRVLASFVLQPTGRPGKGRAPVFVIDIWQTDATPWTLLSRHAALVGGAARAIPGFVPARELPKKY